jgi:hypothetical protein
LSYLENSENQRFLHIQKQRLANLYFSLGWQQKALPLYRSCEAYYKDKPDDILNLAYVSINLGDAYAQTGQANKSISNSKLSVCGLVVSLKHTVFIPSLSLQ